MVGGERVEIAHHEDSTNKHRGVVRKGCTCIIEREGGGVVLQKSQKRVYWPETIRIQILITRRERKKCIYP